MEKSIKKRILLRFVLSGIFFLLLTSCGKNGKYLVAVKSFPKGTPIENTLEVTKVKRFKKSNPIIAYRPPDFCINQSAGNNSRDYIASSQVISTKCGSWLSELERIFASKGYQVISWPTLLSNRSQNETVVEKAKKNNVDILLQINSLEIGITSSGDTLTGNNLAESEWSFFEFVDLVEIENLRHPFPISTIEQTAIISKAPKDAANPSKQLFAMIDVTAIDLSNNQPTWFFRNTMSKQLEKSEKWRGVFWVKGAESIYYPEYTGGVSGGELSSSIKLTNQNKETVDLFRKERYQLIREIVKSLATEFSNN